MNISKHIKTLLLAATALLGVRTASAQLFPNSYINIDWQVNVPLGCDFASKTSGWGMNFEGGYFLTPNFTLGPFIAFHTNLESFPRQTIDLGGGTSLTTTQEHSVYQLPFGVSGRYNWCKKSVFQPYVGMKMGANYAEVSSYYYVIQQYDDTWGFYLSPELGATIYPDPSYRLGIHFALYYSFATNSGDVLNYSVNNLNNFGIRLGIAF